MHYRPDAATPGVFVVGTELEWGLAGLLLAVIMLGVILSKYIPKPAS